MPGYETLEVLHKVDKSSGRLPVEVSIEKQCRIRDDESKTRPFIKMKLAIGNRIIYCDPKQAEDLARLVSKVMPNAKAAIVQLAAEQEAQEAREAQQKKQPGNGHRKGGRKTGATARKREKERRGGRKSSEQRKTDRAQRDRETRQKMQGRKG